MPTDKTYTVPIILPIRLQQISIRWDNIVHDRSDNKNIIIINMNPVIGTEHTNYNTIWKIDNEILTDDKTVLILDFRNNTTHNANR